MAGLPLRMDWLSAAIFAGVLVAIGFGWGLFYWHISTMREATLSRAGAVAAAQSRTLREHAEQAFTSAAYAFRSLDRQPERAGIQFGDDGLVTHALLRRLRDSSPLFEGIGVVDVQGRVSVSADSDPPSAVDLTDRDYFRAHRDNPQLDMLIGTPVVTRPSGTTAIPVSRRLDDELGRFRGIVAARLRPSYFEQLYRSVGADHVSLLLADGTPLVSLAVWQPDDEVARLAMTRWASGLPGPDEGVLETTIPLAGGPQLVGYSRSRQYPIAVAVGFGMDTLLSGWRRERDILAAMALASTAAILLLTVLLLWRIRRQWLLTAALAQARDSANEARVAAETANRSKSDFLAHMSHELRTPLNAIIGFSDMMARQMFGPLGAPRYIEYARIIGKSGLHLLSIINSILDLTKVDAGKWEIEPVPTDLSELAIDLRTLTAGRAEAHDVKVIIDMPPSAAKVTTDRRLLLQVLVNIVTNGIKFTPAGGSVTVSAHIAPDTVSIVIADTGVGMTPEDITKALQPFGRASGILARKYHDTGLGLPLSKRFVDLLGGRLEIDSAPGRGTRVTVHLPLVAPQPPVTSR